MGNTQHNIYCSEKDSKSPTENIGFVCESESLLKQVFISIITLRNASNVSEISTFTQGDTIGYNMDDKSAFSKTTHLEWSLARDDMIRTLALFLKSENKDTNEEILHLTSEINQNGYVEIFLKDGKSIHGGILTCNKFTVSILLDKGEGDITSLNKLGPYEMDKSIDIVERLFTSGSGVSVLADYLQKKNISQITEMFEPNIINEKIIQESSLSKLDPIKLDYLLMRFKHSE